MNLAAKGSTTIWTCDQDLEPELFHANYVANNGALFLYNVRKVTVREAYALRPDVYDKTVRLGGIPLGVQLYWFASEYSNEPL